MSDLIKSINDEALSILLEHKSKNPGFTFWMRKNDTRGRLSSGQWFPGSDYVFISPYKKGDSHNKTPAIGFVVTEKKFYVEIVFCDTENQRNKEFFKKVIGVISDLTDVTDCKKQISIPAQNWQDGLYKFLNEIVPKINEKINYYNLENLFYITEDEFTKMNQKVDQMKKVKNNQSYGGNKSSYSHNTILFGPPGTGKTYNTINHALLALHEDVSMLNRDQQLEKFNEYVSKGQIVFTTFHQSYGYEEFIEGIKPDMESSSNEVKYKVKDGIFKYLCNNSLWRPEIFGSYKVFSITVGSQLVINFFNK